MPSPVSITFQQANTSDGTYDVSRAIPKPVTVESAEPRLAFIGHPSNPGPRFATLVGFVDDPDSAIAFHLADLPEDPTELVGAYPVYLDSTGIWTDTRVISSIISHEPAES